MFRSAYIKCAAVLTLAFAGVALLPTLAAEAPKRGKVVRWTAGAPGSSFLQTANGKYVYVLHADDVDAAITVDSQELTKVRHRPLALLTVRLDVRYAGKSSVPVSAKHTSLEFVSHYQVLKTALDPEELAATIQNNIDSVNDETRHSLKKHPEKKQQAEAALQARLREMTDLLGFVSLYGLHDGKLDAGNPNLSGWLLFDTKSKWIGKWKPQEDLIVRIPVGDETFEFPFALPPHKGDLILRQRTD